MAEKALDADATAARIAQLEGDDSSRASGCSSCAADGRR
jgi:hypothetical protein